MEHGHYDDRFFGVSRYPERPHLLRGGGMGSEVQDVRDDVADSLTEIAWEIDKGIGHGGVSISDATPSEDISGGTDSTFKIAVNGDAAEDVVLDQLTTLNTAALIVAKINAKLKLLSGTNNKAAKCYWYGGRYVFAGPYNPANPAGGALAITDGAANNVADDLKIGVANSGQEIGGSLSGVVDAAAGVGPSPSAYGSVTIADANTTASVTFATAMPDANYAVVATAYEITAGLANVNVFITNKLATGFDINISAAPGGGNSVGVDWMVRR